MMGSKSELACHAGTVMAGVEASWRESKHTDAEIRGDNGAAVRCHKMVLAVSPLLSQMIEDDDEDVLLVLPGVGQQELDLLLLLLYTGRADTYNAGLQELLTRCQVSLKQDQVHLASRTHFVALVIHDICSLKIIPYFADLVIHNICSQKIMPYFF